MARLLDETELVERVAGGREAGLHVMRQHFGAKVAATTARRMVVPPHRDGGQAQYVARPVPVCESEGLAPLLAWISENLADDLDVETLARHHALQLDPRRARTGRGGAARADRRATTSAVREASAPGVPAYVPDARLISTHVAVPLRGYDRTGGGRGSVALPA